MIVTDPADNHRAYLNFARAKDVDGLLSRFTAHGVVVMPDGSEVRGHAAIRGYLESYSHLVSKIDFSLVELIVAGDLALERTSFENEVTLPNGDVHHASGSSTVVLQRQADGNWLIAIDDPRG